MLARRLRLAGEQLRLRQQIEHVVGVLHRLGVDAAQLASCAGVVLPVDVELVAAPSRSTSAVGAGGFADGGAFRCATTRLTIDLLRLLLRRRRRVRGRRPGRQRQRASEPTRRSTRKSICDKNVRMPFSGLDYYALDELLSDDERLVRDTFRRFVDEELMPIVGKHFRAGTFPMELPKKLGALGALGASLRGLRLRRHGRRSPTASSSRSSSAATRASAASARCSASLVMYPIHAFGSDAQKERWLPRMAARRGHRLLRPHRARLRLEPRRHAHHRRQEGRPLGAQRREALDHLGRHRRRRRRLGALPTTARRQAVRGFLVEKRHARASPRATSRASSRCARRSPAS